MKKILMRLGSRILHPNEMWRTITFGYREWRESAVEKRWSKGGRNRCRWARVNRIWHTSPSKSRDVSRCEWQSRRILTQDARRFIASGRREGGRTARPARFLARNRIRTAPTPVRRPRMPEAMRAQPANRPISTSHFRRRDRVPPGSARPPPLPSSLRAPPWPLRRPAPRTAPSRATCLRARVYVGVCMGRLFRFLKDGAPRWWSRRRCSRRRRRSPTR